MDLLYKIHGGVLYRAWDVFRGGGICFFFAFFFLHKISQGEFFFICKPVRDEAVRFITPLPLEARKNFFLILFLSFPSKRYIIPFV